MEEIAKQVTLIISHMVEILAAVIIAIAVLKILWNGVLVFSAQSKKISREETRVEFGSSVAVALELMLGADVLATAVAPSWNDIGQLAAIAIIRTALNYFLGRELKEIRRGNEK